MNLIDGIAQIALSVRDLAGANAFYGGVLGLKHQFDVPNMSFYDIGGVRLMLSAQGGEPGGRGTIVYLKVKDIGAVHAALVARNIRIEQPPHVVGRTPSSEVWLAFCVDPDGNLIGLMSDQPLPN